MNFLPEESIKLYSGCAEKINSYQLLWSNGLPVLKSVYLTKNRLDTLSLIDIEKISSHLNHNKTMIRFIYRNSCHNVKNGGAIVEIDKEALQNELPSDADLWLLEPVKRTENRYCFNASINRTLEVVHLEILGEGFDISDLNKGVISAHEIISMPYPLVEGVFGEWWKWADFKICSEKDYMISKEIRERRLNAFGCNIDIPNKFRPLDLSMLETIRGYLKNIEYLVKQTNYDFFNISCSVLNSGRFIFWDIQTPEGKSIAYL